MHRVVLTLLFAVLIISLNRDETWALPGIADGHLSEADLEEIIDQYNPWPQLVLKSVPACDCAAPTGECDCASDLNVDWCGTPFLQAETEIRKAKEAGLHPWAIARLIERHCGWLGTCKFEL